MLDSDRRLQIFISYSRKDLAAAEQIRDWLIAEGFGAYLDAHDILPGEAWQERLAVLIEKAHAIVFLVSPNSVASPICDWEVSEAERLSKRILPVVIRDIEPGTAPQRLGRLNYIFLRGTDEDSAGLTKLSQALRTDISWVREHTHLGELAADWERAKRAPELLLRGTALSAAELWVSQAHASEQTPTDLHRSFIVASREGEQARAEAERAQLARTRRFQKRAAWGLAAVAVLLAAGLAGAVLQTRSAAMREARVLTSLAQKAIDEGMFDRAMRIAVYGLPPKGSLPFVSPWSPELETKLAGAAFSGRMQCKMPGSAGVNASAILSPVGSHVAINTDDGAARIWDSKICAELFVVREPGKIIVAWSFSNDGKRVSLRFLDALKLTRDREELWDIASGQPSIEAAPSSSSSKSYRAHLASSIRDRNGHYLLVHPLLDWKSQRRGDRILLVDANRSQLDAEVVKRADGMIGLDPPYVVTVASIPASGTIKALFAPDGESVLTVDVKGSVKRWDARTGSQVAVVRDGDDDALTAWFSPGKNRVLLVGKQNADGRASARFVDTNSGAVVDLTESLTPGSAEYSFNPTGTKLVVLNRTSNKAFVLDTGSGRKAFTLEGHEAPLTSAAFSPSDDRVFTTSQDGSVRVWNGADPAHVKEIKGLPAGNIAQTIFRRDGSKALIVLGADDADAKPKVSSWIWNDRNDGMALPLASTSGTGWSERLVRPNADLIEQLPTLSPQATPAWSLVSQQFMSLPKTPGIAIGTWTDGDRIRIATRAEKEDDARIFIRDPARSAGSIMLEGHKLQPYRATFSDNGKRVLTTGSTDFSARLWDVDSGKEIAVLVEGSRLTIDHVVDAGLSPDGSLVVIKTSDQRLHIWSAWPPKQLFNLSVEGMPASITRHGDRAILALDDGFQIIDLRRGERMAKISGFGTNLRRAQFTEDDGGILSLWADRTVRTFDLGWPMRLAGMELRERVCSERLLGASIMTVSDAEDPVLAGTQGVDVCHRPGPLTAGFWLGLFGRVAFRQPAH